MMTQKEQVCIQYAINNVVVKKSIQEREAHRDFKLSTIHAKIMNSRKTDSFNQMILRVGFDFAQRNENFEIREDIIVDVGYSYNKVKDKYTEEYRILNILFVPEI